MVDYLQSKLNTLNKKYKAIRLELAGGMESGDSGCLHVLDIKKSKYIAKYDSIKDAKEDMNTIEKVLMGVKK